MDWLWWVGAALLFIVIEVMSVSLVLVMFAGGAFAAAVANAVGAPFWVQIVVFAVASTVLIVTLRPWLLPRLRARTPLIETNAAAQVGRLGIVVVDVGPLGGRVKLGGEVWTARTTHDGVVLPAGAEVRVVKIEGATAIVRAETAPKPTDPTTPRTPNPPQYRENV